MYMYYTFWNSLNLDQSRWHKCGNKWAHQGHRNWVRLGMVLIIDMWFLNYQYKFTEPANWNYWQINFLDTCISILVNIHILILVKRITACTTNRIWSLSTGVINWRIILLYNFRTTKTQSNPCILMILTLNIHSEEWHWVYFLKWEYINGIVFELKHWPLCSTVSLITG